MYGTISYGQVNYNSSGSIIILPGIIQRHHRIALALVRENVGELGVERQKISRLGLVQTRIKEL